MTQSDYDILIFGAGPAGAAAAAFAAKRGLKTAIVDRSYADVAEPWIEWLHPKADAALADIGIQPDSAVLGVIDRVRFVDATCGRQAHADLPRSISLVDSAKLAKKALSQAKAGGAELHTGQIESVEVRERAVALHPAGGQAIAGKLLIAGDGAGSLAARVMGVDAGSRARKFASCHQAFHAAARPARRSPSRSQSAELTLFLATDDLTRYGYALDFGSGQVGGLVAPASATDLAGQLANLATSWVKNGLAGPELCSPPSAVTSRLVPRGVAMELDSHVSKNAVFIGDAGGFVTAVSHEGLYPAIESARLAVETCAQALKATHPQDVLIEFDSSWRRELADFLRMPNSDLRFLLPLVFSNPRMAKKLAEAFVLGTNI